MTISIADEYLIASEASVDRTREVIKDRLRSPLALVWWNFAVHPKNALVGIVVGSRLFARPIPDDMPIGRYIDSVVVRGRIRPRSDGGSDIRVGVWPSRATGIVIPVILVTSMVLFLLGFILTGLAAFWLGVGLMAVVLALDRAIRRLHRSSEAGEKKLLDEWIHTVVHDLGPSATVDQRR